MKRMIIVSSIALGLLTVGCEDDKKKDTTAEAKKDDATEKKKKKDEKEGDEAAKKKEGGDDDGGSADSSAALAHIGSDCKLAARVDVGAFMSHEAIEKHLLPELDKAMEKPKGAEAKEMKAFFEAAEIDPKTAVEESAICMLELQSGAPGAPPPFYAVMAGELDAKKFGPAMKEHTTGGADLEAAEIGGTKVLKNEKKGMYIGAAGDHKLVLASTKAAFEKALETSDAAKSTFKIDTGKALSVALPKDTVKELGKQAKDNPLQEHTDKVTHAWINVDADSNTLELRAEMTDEKSAVELGGVLKTLLKEMSKKPPKPGNPVAMLGDSLDDAKIDNDGKVLIVSISVPKKMLEEGAEKLAKDMR